MSDWTKAISRIAEREGESGLTSAIPDDPRSPYFSEDDIEALLYEASLLTIREIAMSSPLALGPKAMTTLTGVLNGDVLPLTTLGIYTVTVRSSLLVTSFYPAERDTVKEWYSHKEVSNATLARYTVSVAGKIYHTGADARVTIFREPSLSDFQTDDTILPEATLDDRMEWVHQRLTEVDFMPLYRL